jgi:hypothetical protein
MRNLFLLTFVFITFIGKADEGMFLPIHLKQNASDMQARGLQLTSKEIYNPKKPSVKDAIVSLGGFCTGEIISSKGLMLTNHHCGYDAIRENSTPENDYLTDGFWAKNYGEEKPIPGLTASIVVRIEDVTKSVKKKLHDGMTESERQTAIEEISNVLAMKAVNNTHYEAEVKAFYDGNEFYLFVYEVFTDVRLVGAPPSDIGKYGGDTDNWMWERHTGDFSMFRIYANANNHPAEFAMDNKPYTPKHFLPISLKGVKENDYAMVMGFPGSTDRYLTSHGVKMAVEKDQPSRVKIRGEKLRIMKEDMNESDEVRIQYASTYAQVSNYWKYFIGQTEQLQKNKVFDKKIGIEKAFRDWVNASEKRKLRYGNVLKDMEQAYVKLSEINPTSVYFFEAIYSVGINKFMIQNTRLYNLLKEKNVDQEKVKATTSRLKESTAEFFTTFNLATEEKIVAAMLKMFYEDVPATQRPEKMNELAEKYGNDWNSMVQKSLKESVFANQNRYAGLINNPTKAMFEEDELYMLNNALFQSYLDIVNGKEAINAQGQLDRANRLFVEALRLIYPDKNYYPNANFSLRLTYGNVLPYTSIDGKKYPFYTTMTGLMAKENPKDPDFLVPARLKELYQKKDYGRYGQDGELWVNFITNNDITGGNSGSPVMNAKGELIGCAFDGNWEAMSGDISFEKDFQRTICVDIRYILFIIDKYAGASHLIDEMTIVE